MPRSKQLLDARRLQVLDALFAKGGLRPSLSYLQERTGLSRPTLSASLEFLYNQHAIVSYLPSLNWRKMGFPVEAFSMASFDLSKKTVMDKMVEWGRKNPHVRFFGSIASGDYNLVSRDMYATVEDFHRDTVRLYHEEVPESYPLMRKRAVYFFSEPVYKDDRYSFAVSQILAHNGPAPANKKIQPHDAVRLKIIKALFEPGAIRPHLRTSQRHTGLHLATISSSLDFLQKENIIFEYLPRLNPLAFGLKLFGFLMLQMPPVPREPFTKLVSFAQNDPNVLLFSSIAGSQYNVCIEFLHPDVSSFNRRLQQYYEAVPELVAAPKEILYVTEPIYKNYSRSLTALSLLKQQLGV
ncbi:Lrp/AsnC family transcriptional regulator [Candidatus Micrarchaeota archaeon]|nr:Lrp/AsnC family transcriptional regulator [Candidatus Micrarchaeota archaeon]